MKIRFLNLIIKYISQKVMATYGFGRRFHDLEYLEVGIYFIGLEFIINLRAPLQNLVGKHLIM